MISLKQFVPEIKIMPQGLPRTNEQLVDFLNKNKKEFLKAVYDIDEEFQDDLYLCTPQQWVNSPQNFFYLKEDKEDYAALHTYSMNMYVKLTSTVEREFSNELKINFKNIDLRFHIEW